MEHITIQILKGGFVLSTQGPAGETVQEVLVTQRKLLQRVKEVLEATSLVPVDAE